MCRQENLLPEDCETVTTAAAMIAPITSIIKPVAHQKNHLGHILYLNKREENMAK